MGWTYVQKSHDVSAKEFLKKEFTWASPETGRYSRVLDCAIVRLREAYLAVEYGDAEGPKGVFGLVCLLHYRPREEYNFGYKDMTEDMGPYFYSCPRRILELLTPTENEWAQKWRRICWENIEKKETCARPRLKQGMIIRFAEPVTFRSGRKRQELKVVNPRRLLFADRFGELFKLRRCTLQKTSYEAIERFSA